MTAELTRFPLRRVRLSKDLLVERQDSETLRLIFGREPHCVELSVDENEAEAGARTILLMIENGRAERG